MKIIFFNLFRIVHVATLNGVGFVKLNGIVIAWEHIGLVKKKSQEMRKYINLYFS